MKAATLATPMQAPPFLQRVLALNPVIILIVTLLGVIGTASLYSVADASMRPWAFNHVARFCVAFMLMIGIALMPLRFWQASAFPLYVAGLILLLAVEFIGDVGGGGRRWILLGPLRLQPSEFMKVGIVLVLSSYYHMLTIRQARTMTSLVVPAVLISFPCLLVLRQPDLGTTILIAASGISVVLLGGAPKRLFIGGLLAVSAAVPLAWQYLLRDYQKARVMTFLNPSSDPLGAGYHITQSKIAIGSGGLNGKGFLQGTQSHLNFLPEMHTDFIFTTIAEEHGLIGSLILLTLFLSYLAVGFVIALRCRSQYCRLVALGITMTVFFYVFINVGMVMGLLPVVGVPLPLISYGGSATLTLMAATGFLLNCDINRDLTLPKR
ncbi:MAG: rod shape-determining protein RodA [Pseudomonadota bacterium]